MENEDTVRAGPEEKSLAITVHYSNQCGNAQNCLYPYSGTSGDPEVLKGLFRHDHTFMSNTIYTVDTMGDDAMTDAWITGGLTELIDNTCTSVGNYAFYGRADIQTVVLENVTSIGKEAFRHCTGLVTLSLPKVSYFPTAMEGCTGLKTFDLPLLTDLGSQYFFKGCTELERLDLPRCTHMGCGKIYSAHTFDGCSKLTTLILRSQTMCTLDNTSIFSGSTLLTKTGYVYVPAALVDTYKADEFWSTVADQIRAMQKPLRTRIPALSSLTAPVPPSTRKATASTP